MCLANTQSRASRDPPAVKCTPAPPYSLRPSTRAMRSSVSEALSATSKMRRRFPPLISRRGLNCDDHTRTMSLAPRRTVASTTMSAVSSMSTRSVLASAYTRSAYVPTRTFRTAVYGTRSRPSLLDKCGRGAPTRTSTSWMFPPSE